MPEQREFGHRPRLVLRGRGGWRRRHPMEFEVVGRGARRSYLWVGTEKFVAALSPAEARQLAAFLKENFDA